VKWEGEEERGWERREEKRREEKRREERKRSRYVKFSLTAGRAIDAPAVELMRENTES
jgi:hypothetical protein